MNLGTIRSLKSFQQSLLLVCVDVFIFCHWFKNNFLLFVVLVFVLKDTINLIYICSPGLRLLKLVCCKIRNGLIVVLQGANLVERCGNSICCNLGSSLQPQFLQDL